MFNFTSFQSNASSQDDPLAVEAMKAATALEPFYQQLIKLTNLTEAKGLSACESRNGIVMTAVPSFLFEKLTTPQTMSSRQQQSSPSPFSSIANHIENLYRDSAKQAELATLFQNIMSELHALTHYLPAFHDKSYEAQKAPHLYRIWDILQFLLIHYNAACRVFGPYDDTSTTAAAAATASLPFKLSPNQYEVVNYALTHLKNLNHCSGTSVRCRQMDEDELTQFYHTIFALKSTNLPTDDEKGRFDEFLSDHNKSIKSHNDGELVTWFNRFINGDVALLTSGSSTSYSPYTARCLNLPEQIQNLSTQTIPLSPDQMDPLTRFHLESGIASPIPGVYDPKGENGAVLALKIPANAQTFAENTSLLPFHPSQKVLYYLESALMKGLHYIREFLQKWSGTDHIFALQMLQSLLCFDLPTHLHFLLLDCLSVAVHNFDNVMFSSHAKKYEPESTSIAPNVVPLDITSPFTGSTYVKQSTLAFHEINKSIFQYHLQHTLNMIKQHTPFSTKFAFSPASLLTIFTSTQPPTFQMNLQACSKLFHPLTNFLQFVFNCTMAPHWNELKEAAAIHNKYTNNKKNSSSSSSSSTRSRPKWHPESHLALSYNVLWVARFLLYILVTELRQQQQYTQFEWVNAQNKETIKRQLLSNDSSGDDVHKPISTMSNQIASTSIDASVCSAPLHRYSDIPSQKIDLFPQPGRCPNLEGSKARLLSALSDPQGGLLKVTHIHRDALECKEILAHYDKIEAYLDAHQGQLPQNLALDDVLLPTGGFQQLTFIGEASITREYNVNLHLFDLIDEKKQRIVSKYRGNRSNDVLLSDNKTSTSPTIEKETTTTATVNIEVIKVNTQMPYATTNSFIHKQIFIADGRLVVDLILDLLICMFKHEKLPTSHIPDSFISDIFKYLFTLDSFLFTAVTPSSVIQGLFDFIYKRHEINPKTQSTQSTRCLLQNGLLFNQFQYYTAIAPNGTVALQRHFLTFGGKSQDSNQCIDLYKQYHLDKVCESRKDMIINNNNNTTSHLHLKMTPHATTYYFQSQSANQETNSYDNYAQFLYSNLESHMLPFLLNKTDLFSYMFFTLSSNYHVKRVNRRVFHLLSNLYVGAYDQDPPEDLIDPMFDTLNVMNADEFDPYISPESSRFTQQSALWASPIVSESVLDAVGLYHRVRAQPDDAEPKCESRHILQAYSSLPQNRAGSEQCNLWIMMVVQKILNNYLTAPVQTVAYWNDENQSAPIKQHQAREKERVQQNQDLLSLLGRFGKKELIEGEGEGKSVKSPASSSPSTTSVPTRICNPLLIALLTSGNLSKMFFFLCSAVQPRPSSAFSRYYLFYWQTVFPTLRAVESYITRFTSTYKQQQRQQTKNTTMGMDEIPSQLTLPHLSAPLTPLTASNHYGLVALYCELLNNVIMGNSHTFHDLPWLDDDCDNTVRETYEPVVNVDKSFNKEMDGPYGFMRIAMDHCPEPTDRQFGVKFDHLVYPQPAQPSNQPGTVPIFIDFHSAVTQHCIESFIDLLTDVDIGPIINDIDFTHESSPIAYVPIAHCSPYNPHNTISPDEPSTILNAPSLFDLVPRNSHCISHIAATPPNHPTTHNLLNTSAIVTPTNSPIASQLPLHEVIQIPSKPVHFGFVHQAIVTAAAASTESSDSNPTKRIGSDLASFYATFSVKTALSIADYQSKGCSATAACTDPIYALLSAQTPQPKSSPKNQALPFLFDHDVDPADLKPTNIKDYLIEQVEIWDDIVQTVPDVAPLCDRIPQSLHDIIVTPKNSMPATNASNEGSSPIPQTTHGYKTYPVPLGSKLVARPSPSLPDPQTDMNSPTFLQLGSVSTAQLITALSHINELYKVQTRSDPGTKTTTIPAKPTKTSRPL